MGADLSILGQYLMVEACATHASKQRSDDYRQSRAETKLWLRHELRCGRGLDLSCR